MDETVLEVLELEASRLRAGRRSYRRILLAYFACVLLFLAYRVPISELTDLAGKSLRATDNKFTGMIDITPLTINPNPGQTIGKSPNRIKTRRNNKFTGNINVTKFIINSYSRQSFGKACRPIELWFDYYLSRLINKAIFTINAYRCESL